MRASQIDTHGQAAYEALPNALPEIELHHGEALWVLARLGFQGAASKSTFYEYIKSLRKLGTPFGRGKMRLARRGLASLLILSLDGTCARLDAARLPRCPGFGAR